MYLNTPSPKQIGKKGEGNHFKRKVVCNSLSERPVVERTVSSELYVIIAHVLHSEDFSSHQTYFKM